MEKIRGRLAAASAACLLVFQVSVSHADGTGTFLVPDTGITKCYDAAGNEIYPCPGPGQYYYGQDGNRIGISMSFTENAETVTDNVNGLMWQKTPDSDPFDWGAAVTYCSGLDLAGQNTGWRLPDMVELNSILDLSVDISSGDEAAVNSAFAGPAASYWSSVEDAADPANAWALDFSSAEDGPVAKTSQFYARCVREVAQ